MLAGMISETPNYRNEISAECFSFVFLLLAAAPRPASAALDPGPLADTPLLTFLFSSVLTACLAFLSLEMSIPIVLVICILRLSDWRHLT